MEPILLACGSAALFGGMTVLLRIGLRSGGNADEGTITTVAAAVGVIGAYVAVRGEWDLPRAWPFLVADRKSVV